MTLAEIPEFAETLGRRGDRSLRVDRMAAIAIGDEAIALPALSSKMPLEAILEWRRDHADELPGHDDHERHQQPGH